MRVLKSSKRKEGNHANKPQSLYEPPRILAGRFRGRCLETLPCFRPSTARLRETLFGMLEGGRFEGPKGGSPLKQAYLLDVCAGSGALAFEALSRGAAYAILLERSPKIRALLRRNRDLLGVNSQITIMDVDAFAPPRPIAPRASLVLLDPPYHQRPAHCALEALWCAGWITPHALCVIEQAYGDEISAPSYFQRLTIRRISQSCLILLRAPKDEDIIARG